MRSVTASRIGALSVRRGRRRRANAPARAERLVGRDGLRAHPGDVSSPLPRPRLALVPALALAASTACAQREPGTVLEVDSAGVRIVESRAPAWPSGTEWRVNPEPVFRLGGARDDPSSNFFRILDVALLEGGEVIVIDGGTSEIRGFDATGRHLWSTGGGGDGPGEFRAPRYLGRREDGALLIWDRSLLRLSVIEHGEVTLAERRNAPGGSTFIAEGLFDDGAWLVAYPAVRQAPESGAAWTDSVRLGRHDPVLKEDVPLAMVPGTAFVWTGAYQLPAPFSPRPLRAIVGDRLAVASGPAPEVAVHDAGGALVTRYRIARESVPVTESDAERMVESLVELGQGSAAAWRQWRNRMEIPSREPAFDRLLADGYGNLWARRFTADLLSREPAAWDVFDPAGTWLGVVATPGGMVVTAIRDGLVAGVYRDEMGVEHVSVHRLATDGSLENASSRPRAAAPAGYDHAPAHETIRQCRIRVHHSPSAPAHLAFRTLCPRRPLFVRQKTVFMANK